MDTIETSNNERSAVVDSRRQALDVWVAQVLGLELVEGVSVSSDASFRRYFRYPYNAHSAIAMDAPPDRENCAQFVIVAQRLAKCGVTVPDILADDIDRGFLLLSDLGDQTYLDVLDSSNADRLFNDAIATLIRFQQHADTHALPVYDQAMLRRELELFPQWYLQAHLGWSIDSTLRGRIDALFDVLIKQALAQPTVFVHRDYMPRNLMVCQANPGVLDFQDAVRGPVSYDAISLFKDAFISWPEPLVEQWLHRYWTSAVAAGLPVPDSFAQFQLDCDLMGAQRHLKVIGIFARIYHRDGKSGYLEDVPRFLSYLDRVAKRRPQLSMLTELLESLDTQGEGMA